VIQESPHAAHFKDRIAALTPKIRLAASYINSGYDTRIPKVGHSVVEPRRESRRQQKPSGRLRGVFARRRSSSRKRRSSSPTPSRSATRKASSSKTAAATPATTSSAACSAACLLCTFPLPEFEAVLPAAVAWQISRVLPSGGSRRHRQHPAPASARSPMPRGKPKTVNYKEVVAALTLYGTSSSRRRRPGRRRPRLRLWSKDRQTVAPMELVPSSSPALFGCVTTLAARRRGEVLPLPLPGPLLAALTAGDKARRLRASPAPITSTAVGSKPARSAAPVAP